MKKKIYKRLAAVGSVAAISAVLLLSNLAAASFSDVKTDSPNYDAITYVQQNNIVSGYADGSFKPLNHINRAEFTKIIVSATLNYDPTKDPSGYDIYSLSGVGFPDIKSGEWYIPYLRKAVQQGLIAGYPDGTFKPGNDISFVEAAKIIVKAFSFKTSEDPIWYKPFVSKLGDLKAIPTTITGFDYKISRGEMVEMIYRIKASISTKPSLSYTIMTGTSSAGTGGSTGGAGAGSSPIISSTCTVFPTDNSWNQDVSSAPLDSNSSNYISNILANGGQNLHPDFGGNGQYGIPYSIVGGEQPKVPINFTDYGSESDPGPYPIPTSAQVEGGSDAHVLVVDKDSCTLYELYGAAKVGNGWNAASGAIFDLKSNKLRPEGWTSADAAGLPIFPGLVRYDEIANGEINHALRFTVSKTQAGYIHPATHFASSSTDSNRPPMGLRLRLKANFDTSKYTGESLIILKALKKYGMIVADNGSNWYITGATDKRWNDDNLNQLKGVPGSEFEVVKTGAIIK